MKILDAYLLASTKRKTRKVRTAVIVVVSSFLFALLFLGVILLAGLQNSANGYKNAGLNDRFVSQVQSTDFGRAYEPAQQQATNQVNAELTERGIKITDDLKDHQEYQSEIQQRAMRLMDKSTAQQQAEYEAEVKAKFEPVGVYHLAPVPRLNPNNLGQFEQQTDSFLQRTTQGVNSPDKPMPPSSSPWNVGPDNITYMSLEKEVLSAFKRPNQSLDWQPGQPYPVLISYQYLRQQLGGTSFQNIPKAEVNKRYRELIQTYTGKELSFCYRNDAAKNELEQVLRYNKRATEDEDTTTKPVEVANCQGFDATVLTKLGITTTAEPAANQPKPLFPKAKDQVEQPQVKPVKFRIVGFIPSLEAQPNMDLLSGLFFMVNNWAVQNPFIIPTHVVQQDTWLKEVTGNNANIFGFQTGQLLVEQTSRAEQKRFVASGCKGEECVNGGKPMIQPFGSVKVALEQVIEFVLKGLFIAVAVISAIASIMFMTTISKIIADSMREIAVFRAIGASKLDIAQIYLFYGIMIAFSSLLTALLVAFASAFIFDYYFSASLTQTFVSVLGAYDSNVKATLVGVNLVWLGVIAGGLLGSAVLGIVIAVLSNGRRDIVKYMREE